MTEPATTVGAAETGWQARLELAFAARDRRTVLTRRRHTGPIYVQRALYPETDGTAHVMLLHPPGGLVQGDRIDIAVTAPADARALITTPSASKFYRTPAGGTAQAVEISVADGGALEWLPQEAILFDGAVVASRLDLSLAREARVLAWDVFTLGRPAIGERLDAGSLDAEMTVCIDGHPTLSERTRVPGLKQSALQDAVWGLGGARTMGTLVAYRPQGFGQTDLDALRDALAGHEIRHGATRVDELLVVRAQGRSAAPVRAVLETAWRTLRPMVYDKPGVAPRIWAT